MRAARPIRRRRRFGPASAVALLPAIALAACGDPEIAADKVERTALKSLNPAPQSISCPDGVRPESGAKFTCEVVYHDGDAGRLLVHVIDDEGHIVADPSALTIDTIGAPHAENTIRELAENNNVGLRELRCPPDTPVADGLIKCQVSDIKGVTVDATLRIGPNATLGIDPATDFKVKRKGKKRGRATG